MSISLDNISYFKIKDIPDPKNLICCICYCLINKNGQQCKNSKCLKIYCEDCCLKLKFQNTPCSYCRISKEYVGLDSNIITCLDNLLFFCPEFGCKEHYTLEDYKSNHTHKNEQNEENKNLTKCNICQFILDKNPNSLTCNICNEKYCFRNVEYVPYKVSKTRIKKFFKNDDMCIKRCINCLLPICNRCNIKIKRYNLNNFICEYCEVKCFICSSNNALTYCDDCHKSICENCLKIDKANNLILCANDYNKNSIARKIEKYFVLEKYEKCPICGNKIMDINELVKCKESKCKNKYVCYKCSLFCNICKKIICKNCGLYCNQCSNTSSLVSCKTCDSNTIKKCSKDNCENKLCINCYNSCNKCNIILCDNHKNQCLNCEDVMCDKHFSICKICDKEGYKKACFKKCTYKCFFCENMNNELCNKNNHKNNYVQKYNCEHNICLNCVKKCENCEKIVKSCLRCTVDYYFVHCNFCDKYKCFDCGKQCKICEDYYCDYKHKCDLCKEIIKENTCLKCITNSRVKCCSCKKSLRQCDECKKILVCSKKCYENNKNNRKHLCQMFICDECLDKENQINNSIKQNLDEIKERVVKIKENVKQYSININTSGRKINSNSNEQLNVLNIQNNPSGKTILNDNIKENSVIKEERKKIICCCNSCNIY